jgi:hypothetical protein
MNAADITLLRLINNPTSVVYIAEFNTISLRIQPSFGRNRVFGVPENWAFAQARHQSKYGEHQNLAKLKVRPLAGTPIRQWNAYTTLAVLYESCGTTVIVCLL